MFIKNDRDTSVSIRRNKDAPIYRVIHERNKSSVNILIHELNHILASWLCLWRFCRIPQGDAVEQLVILGECHAVEVRLG